MASVNPNRYPTQEQMLKAARVCADWEFMCFGRPLAESLSASQWTASIKKSSRKVHLYRALGIAFTLLLLLNVGAGVLFAHAMSLAAILGNFIVVWVCRGTTEKWKRRTRLIREWFQQEEWGRPEYIWHYPNHALWLPRYYIATALHRQGDVKVIACSSNVDCMPHEADETRLFSTKFQALRWIATQKKHELALIKAHPRLPLSLIKVERNIPIRVP